MPVSISGAGSISGLDQGFNVTTGSVGIGTDNPSHELDIESVSPTIELKDSDNDYKFQLTQSGSATYVDFDTDGGGSSSLRIRNAYDEKIRIQSDGTVGIGTNNPNGLLALTAASGRLLTLRNSTTGSGSGDGSYLALNGSDFQIANAEAANVILYTADTERVRILSTGTVNIGDQGLSSEYLSSTVKIRKDQNSVTRLSLRNENSGSGSASAIQVGAFGNSWMLQCGSAANDSNAFTIRVDGSANSNTGTEKLRITTAGDVGIASAAPSHRLEVAYNDDDDGFVINNIGRGGKFRFATSGSNAENFDVQRYDNANSTFRRYLLFGPDQFAVYTGSTTSSTERLRISSDGKVCVGTTLTNYGVLQIRDASGDGTTSAIQVENASSGNSTTNVILRSVSLNSGAWANAEYRAKSHVFSFQTTPVLSVLANYGPWAEGNKGTTRGTLHLRPESTDHMGGAITFGASDSGSGETAMAGIYTRTDGNYGSKMYFATTDSYATGPKNAMYIDHYGYVHDSNRPYIYGSVTNTNGSGVANNMYVASSRNLSFSNSRITVPVSGVYHICFNTICDTGVGRIDAHIYVNGSAKVNSLNDTNTDGYHYRGMSISLMLSANDYIQFNNNDWYDATSTTMQTWRTVSVVFLG